MFQALFDLIRIVGAIGLLYVVLPVLSARAGDKWRGPWMRLIVPASIRTLLVMEFSCIVLGSWKLCLPGIVMTIYLLWVGFNVVMASHRRWIYDAGAWQAGYARFWLWWERREAIAAQFQRVISISQTGLILGLILLSATVQFLWYPLNNFRFLGIQTYARVVSLQTLVTGNPWNADGSVAFLAPVVFVSGLDAATVVRLSAPLIVALLMAAVAWCAFQYSRAMWCSTFAAGLFWVYTRNIGLDSTGEPGGLEISAFLLVLTAGCMRRAPGYAACAALLAWVVEPSFPGVFLAALACILLALFLHWCHCRAPRILRQSVTAAFLIFLGISLNSAFSSTPPDGPYEYESSARMAARIARQYPRNRWVLVSPIHEAAYSYGRGWHVELTEFLHSYSEATVSNPNFQFPYEADNIFVFIEKTPLPQLGRLALPGSSGRSFFYSTASGRASMEFEAARLMAAYGAGHKNASVYFEDAELIVYRIAK